MEEKRTDGKPRPSIASASGIDYTDDRGSIKILVVDDDEFVLELISEFLLDKGYSVITAPTGEEAVEKFKADPAQIAMVDFKLPGLDGLATIVKLREIDASVVAIFMTGFPTIDSSIRALRLGAADYILKPFELDEVELAVQKAVREWRFKAELNRLRERVSKLEGNIAENRENIKLNKKLGVLAGPGGYSTGIIDLSCVKPPEESAT